MGTEIERKFLVNNDSWREHIRGGILLQQGYLASDGSGSVRVRLVENRGYLTVKGPSGIKRSEFEYEIPADDANEMLGTLCSSVLVKMRYTVKVGAHLWTIDQFTGKNAGLILAEIELTSQDEQFEQPGWLGVEVTNDKRYYNSYLAQHPYCTWFSVQKVPKDIRESGAKPRKLVQSCSDVSKNARQESSGGAR